MLRFIEQYELDWAYWAVDGEVSEGEEAKYSKYSK